MPRTEKDPHGGEDNAREDVASHAAERSRTQMPPAEGRAQQAEGGVQAAGHGRPDGIGTLGQAIEAGGLPVEEAARGLGSLSRDLMSAASQCFEQSSHAIQNLMQARTVHDVLRAQIDLTSCLMDAQLRYVEAIGHAATQMGGTGVHKAPAHMPKHVATARAPVAKH